MQASFPSCCPQVTLSLVVTGQKCPRPFHPGHSLGQGLVVMQVSNSHIQQKPLHFQLHNVCTEGEEHRLRCSFEVQYTHTKTPVLSFLDSGPSITSSTFKCLCVVGAEGDVRILGTSATRLASDGKVLFSPDMEIWLLHARKN